MHSLPSDKFPLDQIRDPQAIARRALALFAVVGMALGAPRGELMQWLRDESLWGELSPEELAYVSSPSPTRQLEINATWRSEALLVLLWSLGVVSSMPALNEQCDTGELQRILPPFADVSVSQFINASNRRSDEELIELADSLHNSHWKARDARIHGKAAPPGFDIGIIQERHHAINWIVGYGNLPWDEVTTDT